MTSPTAAMMECMSTDDPFTSNAGDHARTVARFTLAGLAEVPFAGTAAALALEALPSASDRQHTRALRTLWRLVHDLQDVVSAQNWRTASGTEAFDAAVVRSLRAAEEANVEGKRELIWYGLINGWVRTSGDPERDRFLRIVAKYDLEHFQILERIQPPLDERPSWSSVASDLVETIGGDRFTARAYLHEFHADGLLRIYDQPSIRRNDPDTIHTNEIALWTDAAEQAARVRQASVPARRLSRRPPNQVRSPACSVAGLVPGAELTVSGHAQSR